MKFVSDFRVSNPALHQLYLGYAIETLDILREPLQELDDCSRVSACLIAGAIREAIRREAARDAAWFEACALQYLYVSSFEELQKTVQEP